MELSSERILMFEKSMNLGGSSQIVLQMCEVLKDKVEKIVVCSMGGVNIEKLNKIGIEHYAIKDISEITNSVSVLFALVKIIKHERITTIHTHHRMAAFYAHFLRALFGVKVVCSIHGEFYDKKILTKIAYHNCKLLACGNAVKHNLVAEYEINPDDVLVLRNTVKKTGEYDEIAEIDGIREKNKNAFIIGYLGRLSEEKGVAVFVKSLEKVLAKNREVYYIIAGDGYQREFLINLSKEIGAEEHIVFLGYRSDPQNVIQQLDGVALCSFTEGLPLTPIEAFAYGKPVIATAVGGTIEIVKDAYNGILVNPGDSESISEAILKLSRDKNLYRKLSNNAVNSYNREFSYSAFESRLLELYRNEL